MMNPAHLHLLLNHSPIIGTIIALLMFAAALISKGNELKQASLALFVLIALVSIPAFMSGYGAQNLIKDNPDVAMDLIKAHQGAALLAFTLMEITGAVALFALWRFSRTVKNPFLSEPSRVSLFVVLVLAASTVGLMAVTGTTGGDIRHPEITQAGGVTSMVAGI